MEVILLERVSKLGFPGEVVKVKPGYARNFLIPRSKALRATEANKAFFEAKKKELEVENEQRRNEAKANISAIDGKFVILIRQAGEDGRLFGSVSSRDIAESLTKAYNLEIMRNQVIINNPVKYLGVFEIEVVLHADVSTKIRLNVARTEDEAEEARKSYLNPEAKKAETIEALPKKTTKKKASEEELQVSEEGEPQE
jgi:large subunit ribosomal protein L9